MCACVWKCVFLIRCEAARALNFPAVPSKDLLPLYITLPLSLSHTHTHTHTHNTCAFILPLCSGWPTKTHWNTHTHTHTHDKTEPAICCVYTNSTGAHRDTHPRTQTQCPLLFCHYGSGCPHIINYKHTHSVVIEELLGTFNKLKADVWLYGTPSPTQAAVASFYMWAGTSALLAAVIQRHPGKHTDPFSSQLWLQPRQSGQAKVLTEETAARKRSKIPKMFRVQWYKV